MPGSYSIRVGKFCLLDVVQFVVNGAVTELS